MTLVFNGGVEDSGIADWQDDDFASALSFSPPGTGTGTGMMTSSADDNRGAAEARSHYLLLVFGRFILMTSQYYRYCSLGYCTTGNKQQTQHIHE
jgi:hypothetical protein